MKKLCFNMAAAFLMIGLAGCSTYQINRIPMTSVPLAEMTTTATYDVLGPAIGTSSRGMLFGFIALGGENKSGQLAGMMFMNPVEAAAVYNAIESVPTADALIAPRWEKTTSNYFIYTEEKVTVKGKAIRYNVSAK